MEVRITYRSEVYLKGDNLAEIKEKWENLNLDPISKDETEGFGFVEIVSVEDADTYKDLESEFENAYHGEEEGEPFESYGLDYEQEQVALYLYKENKRWYGNYTLEELDRETIEIFAEDAEDEEEREFYRDALKYHYQVYQLVDHLGDLKQPIGEIVFWD